MKKKTVKAWAIVQGTKIKEDRAYAYTFEVEEKIPHQNILLVHPSKAAAEKWVKKWHSIGPLKIRPVTITYEI